jgi:hypothetical protein
VSKSKRKISRSQRDKYNISVAKKLKEAGIISKKANLHSGRFISRGVLAKVKEYEAAANLGYKAVQVSKETAKAAKERGFQVVAGNKIIGPATPVFKKRLKEGTLTGVRPVKGGMMEEVVLPHNVMDMQSLVKQLEDGIDTLKMPNEQFAFTYHGSESYRAFPSTKELLEYMRHYRGIFDANGSMRAEDLQEEFAGFRIFRLHPSTINRNIPGPKARRERAKRQRMEAIARGEYVAPKRQRKSYAEKLEEMHPGRAKKYRERKAAKDRAKREALMADPKAYAEYKEKAKARAKKSRERNK